MFDDKDKYIKQEIGNDVINLARQGDRSCFEQMIRFYGDFVFNVSFRILGNKEDAKDVSQEVFLILHRYLRGFQGRSTLKTWLYRVAVNQSLNYIKKQKKQLMKCEEYDEQKHAQAKDIKIDFLKQEDCIENRVNFLLSKLSDEQRVCMVLRSVDGLSYQQIAEVLGVNVNVVRSRLKRGREKLLSCKKGIEDAVM